MRSWDQHPGVQRAGGVELGLDLAQREDADRADLLGQPLLVVGADRVVVGDRRALGADRVGGKTAPVSVILTVIPQQPEAQFVTAFMESFASTDWTSAASVREWPSSPF